MIPRCQHTDDTNCAGDFAWLTTVTFVLDLFIGPAALVFGQFADEKFSKK